MGSLLWILKATPKVIMKLLVGLALLVASASAFDLSKLRLAASPTADNVEYGFCEGSPEPASIDNISVEPFPILIQNGATVTLNVQITLNEPLPAGASVALDLVLEGIIPIKIPCPTLMVSALAPALTLATSCWQWLRLLVSAHNTSPRARPVPSPSTQACMAAATLSPSAPLSPFPTSSSPS